MSLAEITNYCANSPAAPTILYAAIPTPNQTVNSFTYFTCYPGYQSSGGGTQPFFTCNANTAAAGAWSSGVTYSCESTQTSVRFRV